MGEMLEMCRWDSLKTRRPAPVVTPVHVHGDPDVIQHPLETIATIDAGADHAEAGGRPEKAEAMRRYAGELLGAWLREEFER